MEFGSAHGAITRASMEGHADLIVIGVGESHSLRERILGSTADRVIRAAAMPVLVVRKPTTGAYQKIVVAVDFSQQSAAALREAAK